MSALQAVGIRVEYGPVTAVHGVDLSVSPGELLSVTGPSGAGKTSLLWVLGGALVPAAGTVRLGDVPVVDRQQAAALGIAVVPQGNALAQALTAAENVLVPLLASGVPPAEGRARTQEALSVVGLEESGGHLIEELSGGQQQRVALARALARRAAVLLADEPTSELDAGNRERMIAVLRAEADRGAVVVMTTHDPEAAAQTDGELALDSGVPRWVRRLGTPNGEREGELGSPSAPSHASTDSRAGRT